MEENRIGVAAIIIENPDSVQEVNEALHKFSRLIVGRLGIPYRERGVAVISVILDGTTDDISALTASSVVTRFFPMNPFAPVISIFIAVHFSNRCFL